MGDKKQLNFFCLCDRMNKQKNCKCKKGGRNNQKPIELVFTIENIELNWFKWVLFVKKTVQFSWWNPSTLNH